MGILPKLYNTVKKEYIDSLNNFESDLYKLQEDINSKLITIMGTKGDFKGTSLISSTDDEMIVKKFSERVSDKLPEFEDLLRDPIFNQIVLNYEDILLFFKPMTKKIGILAIVREVDDIKIIKKWLKEKSTILENIFEEKLEL
jgi:hypothetical protein